MGFDDKLILLEKKSTFNCVSNNIKSKCIKNPPMAKIIMYFSNSLTLDSENSFS